MNVAEYLRANEHKGAESFISKAEFIRENWIWLKYSYAISIKVRHRMKELGMTQKQLAEKLGCTQQHISILLQGRSNMTIETLAKLEQALDFDLIGSNLESFNYPTIDTPAPGYLNDPQGKQTDTGTGTSSLVNGYKSRKKKGPKPKTTGR